jgi:hypothetical protein
MFLTALKTGTRALAVSALIATTAIAAAAPAQAQSFSFNFGINGGGSSFSYGIGSGGKKFKRDCLTNREIRRGLQDAGFYDIEIVGQSGVRVRVIATWEDNDRDYSMLVNRCSGKVTDIERIRQGKPGGARVSRSVPVKPYKPGLSFQFSY